LRDLGFVAGTRIAVLRAAPLGDPVLYELRGYELSLRRSEASRVRIRSVDGSGIGAP
jgi:ferrous iron transport protein A